MAPFAASNTSFSGGDDSSAFTSSPLPLAKKLAQPPPSMLPPTLPQLHASGGQSEFDFGAKGLHNASSTQGFFGQAMDTGLATPAAAAAAASRGGSGVDYFAVSPRQGLGGVGSTPGGLNLSVATPAGEPHPWAALFGQSNGPATVSMGGGGGSITPLVGDHSAFAAAAAAAASASGAADGGTTPTLRFPSALSGVGGAAAAAAGMTRNFSGGLSGHGTRNASQASSTMSTSFSSSNNSESDTARFTPLDSHHLAMLLSSDNSVASSVSSHAAASSGSLHVNGGVDGTWNHPRLRRASRSSSPGGSSSSSTASSDYDSARTLVLDIRPSTSFGAARIRRSVNICAPSTLLKRPGMTVQRIEEEMLASRADARRFARWKRGVRGAAGKKRNNSSDSNSDSALDTTTDDEADEKLPRLQRIVVLDTDTRRVNDAGRSNAGGGGACLIGLLRKFEVAGFEGELCWLVGGFNGFARTTDADKELDADALIDRKPVRHDESSSLSDQAKAPPRADPPRHSGQILNVSNLKRSESSRRSSAPSHLAQQPNMQQVQQAPHPKDNDDRVAHPAAQQPKPRRRDLVQPRALPAEAFTSSSLAEWGPSGQSRTRGMVGSTSQPQGLDVPLPDNACANPFFDNIRQNRELAHGVTERVPLEIPTLTSTQRASLPSFLARLVDAAPEVRADELAQAFYDIERDEQRRLMLTMRQHASESLVDPRRLGGGADPSSDAGVRGTAPQLSSRFCALDAQPRHDVPFSIAAALERGGENRYNNIWTYEHSRVKIVAPPSGTCDYLNASFVEPAREHGSLRRYIATQAPLPSTFEAFWTAVWEQRCACIAMLTREHESGRIQSHMYWGNGAYGKRLELRLVHEESLDEKGNVLDDIAQGAAPGKDDGGGNLFPSMSGGDSSDGRQAGREACIIVRTLELSMPETREKRLVTQLQYVAWPDYHIPDSPEALLTYMDLAAALQQAADDELRRSSSSSSFTTSHGQESLVGPMVVHCSAGVGRTGTYVVIDSVLDVLRRRRAAARGEAAPKCWENGAGISIAGGVIQRRGRSTAASSNRDVRMHSPGLALASASPVPSKGFEGFKLDNSSAAVRTPRKSLKRELSPSAMDLDAPGETTTTYQAAGSERKDMSSPPPMRRSRSDADSNPEEEASLAAPTARQNSLTGLTSAVTQMGRAVGNATQGQQQRSGSETPSKAMGGLRIAWDSTGSNSPQQPSTPTPGSAASPFASAIAQGPLPVLQLRSPKATSNDTNMKGTDGSPKSDASAPSSAPAPIRQSSSSRSKNTSEATDLDLIRGAVEVTREQRMSSVQTTRQYVFVYAAVLQGVLREVRREAGQQ